MASSAPQNAEFINIAKDGKVAKIRLLLQGNEVNQFNPTISLPSSTANPHNVGRFTLMVPSKQSNNSRIEVSTNPIKDLWIYKPNSGTGILPNSSQHLAPVQILKAGSMRPHGVSPSQCYILPPQKSQVNGTRLITTTQSPRIAGPSVIRAPQVNVVQTILPTENKLLTPPVRITTSHSFPRYFATQLPTASTQPVQIVTCDVGDNDEDFLDNISDEDDFLKCCECNITFETREELEQHESNHLGEVNYICDKCGKEFSTKRSLQDHLQDHDTEKKFECDGCHKKFDYRDNLIFHMRIHGNLGSFKCPVCFKKFGNKSMRDNHVRKHTAEEIGSQHFVLQNNRAPKNGVVKNQKFLVSSRVTPQSDVVGSQNLVSTSKNQNLVVNSNINSGDDSATSQKRKLPYACSICFKRFPLLETLNMHRLTHIKYDKRPQQQQMKIQEAEEMKFTCRGCNKTFNSEHYQRVHEAVCKVKNKKNIHKDKVLSNVRSPCKQTANKDKVKCSFCHKDYTCGPESKDNSAQNSTKFICEACCTFLAQKSQVSGFMPRLENRFICVKCDECFANETQLRDHLLSHENNLFKCDTCGNCYETKMALSIHEAQHVIESKDSKTKKGNHGSPGKRVRQKDETSKASDSNASQQKLSGSTMSGNRKRSKSNEVSQSPRKSQKARDINARERRKPRDTDARKRQKARDTDEDEDLVFSDSNSNAFPNEEDDQVAEGDVDTNDPFAEEDMVIKEDLFADDDDPFAEVDMDTKVFIKQEPLDFEGFEDTDTGNCTVFSAMSSFMPSFDIPDKIIKEEKLDDYERGSDSVKEENFNEMTIKEEIDDLDLIDFEVSIKEEKEDECDDLPNFPPDRFDFNSFREDDARSSSSES